MANETQLKKVEMSVLSQTQEQFITELIKVGHNVQCEITEYGIRCANNIIVYIDQFLKSKNMSLKDINKSQFMAAIQMVAYTELNASAIPAELYIDLRKDYNSNNYSLSVKPQGAGNEKLTRKWGVNVKTLYQPWLVRENDEFTLPSYDGVKIIAPKWTPKSYDGKVIFVVYPLETQSGYVEYLIASSIVTGKQIGRAHV